MRMLKTAVFTALYIACFSCAAFAALADESMPQPPSGAVAKEDCITDALGNCKEASWLDNVGYNASCAIACKNSGGVWNASTQKCSCLAHEHGLLAVISGCTCQGVPNNPCSGDKPVFIDGQCYALCDTPGQDIYSFCGDCGTKTDKCLQRPNDSHPEAGYLVPGTCQVLGGSSGFEFEGGTLLEGEKQKLTDGLSVKP